MLRRIVTALLVLVGLVIAGLGIASGTVWRPSDTVTLGTGEPDASGAATVVRTDPGVLGLVDDTVTIRATAPEGASVVLAIGHARDVEGWIGQDASVAITGARDWETLSTEDREAAEPTEETPTEETPAEEAPAEEAPAEEAPAEEAPAEEAPAEEAPTEAAPAVPAPDPTGSDMWLAEVAGGETAELEWTVSADTEVVLAAAVGTTTQAPAVTLTWPREVTTPWVWPGVIVGGLLVLAGLLLAYLWFFSKRARGQSLVEDTDVDFGNGLGGPRSATGPGSTVDLAKPRTPLQGVGSRTVVGADPVEDVAPAGVARTGLTRRELREQTERERVAAEEAARQTAPPARRGLRRPGGRPQSVPEADAPAEHGSSAEQKPKRAWPWTGALQTVLPRGENGRARPKTEAVPVVQPAPEPHRPSWLPEGTTSASASSWRQAWGVRPGAGAQAPDATAPEPTRSWRPGGLREDETRTGEQPDDRTREGDR